MSARMTPDGIVPNSAVPNGITRSGPAPVQIDLKALARRIPLASDRALAEIVNGLATVDSMNDARAKEGFFRRAIGFGRKDRARALETSAALAQSQRQLVVWAREIGGHLAFTDLTVGLLAEEVEELQQDVVRVGAMARQALEEICELAGILAGFMDHVERRFAEIDHRLDAHAQVLDAHARALLELDRRTLATELWQAAWAEGDRTARGWKHGGTYRGLPWTCQVLLLARQSASGAPGLHEFITGDRGWRDRLADDILADPQTEQARLAFDAQGTRTIRRLVVDAIGGLPQPNDRRMVAELLGIGLPAHLRPGHRPIGFAVAHGLELAAREPQALATELSRAAVARAREDYGPLPDYVTCEQFVRRVVDEQADAALLARADLREARKNTPEGPDGPDGQDHGDEESPSQPRLGR